MVESYCLALNELKDAQIREEVMNLIMEDQIMEAEMRDRVMNMAAEDQMRKECLAEEADAWAAVARESKVSMWQQTKQFFHSFINNN